MFSDQSKVYVQQQEEGRKHLWREALEASSEGDMFLLSLLEVILEDEKEQADRAQKQAELSKMLKGEARTISYRPNDYSDWCRSFVDDTLYKVCSVALIIAAGVVGAIEVEYREGQKKPTSLIVIDFMLIAWFCVECNIHIGAEGDHPQCYFFGRDSEVWTVAARWNVFDFTVSYTTLVLATIITEAGDGSYRIVVLFRLLRLLRLATLLNKTPELTVIVAGFISAVNSVIYILLVLVIVFYMYAVLGFSLFAENDPFRFGSVGMAMLTLLQCATLSYWHQVFYTQRLGCDAYPGTLYASQQTLLEIVQAHHHHDDELDTELDHEHYDQYHGPEYDQLLLGLDGHDNGHVDGAASKRVHTAAGSFPLPLCEHPVAQPVASALFFVTFTGLTAFIILSLFVGIITLSMLEQMETHIRSKRQKSKAIEFREQLSVSLEHAIDLTEQQTMQDAASDGWTAAANKQPPQRKASASMPPSSKKKRASQAAPLLSAKSRSLSSTPSLEMVKAGGDGADDDVDLEEANLRPDMFKDIDFQVDFTNDHEEDEAEMERLRYDFSDENDIKDPLLSSPSTNQLNQSGRKLPSSGSRQTKAATNLKREWKDEELIKGAMKFLRRSNKHSNSGRSTTPFKLVAEPPAQDSPLCVSLAKFAFGKRSGKHAWSTVAKHAKAVVAHARFETAITLAVVAATVLVVLGSLRTRTNQEALDGPLLDVLNTAVLMVFAAEVVLKIVSEGLAPISYFNDNWNVFDFTVVAVSLGFLLIDSGSNVSILRTMRLLQVVKLTKRFRNLRVLIEALFTGFASVGYIMVLISVFNFIFGIAGVNYFNGNDGFNFGSVRVAMVTLFRIETLQAWEEVMFVSLLGCNHFAVAETSAFHQNSCHVPYASGYFVLVYYGLVVVFGALVMPSLLVAIITAAVKESDFEVKEDLEMEQRVSKVVSQYRSVFQGGGSGTGSRMGHQSHGHGRHMLPHSVSSIDEGDDYEDKVLMYDILFRFGDKDGSGSLDLEEIMSILSHVTDFGGAHFNRDLTMQVFLCVDKDRDEAIDKAEFFEMVGKILMVVQKLEKQGLSFDQNGSGTQRRSMINTMLPALATSSSSSSPTELPTSACGGGQDSSSKTPPSSSASLTERIMNASYASEAAAAPPSSSSDLHRQSGSFVDRVALFSSSGTAAAAAVAAAAASTATSPSEPTAKVPLQPPPQQQVAGLAPNWAAIVELVEAVLRKNKLEWEIYDSETRAQEEEEEEDRKCNEKTAAAQKTFDVTFAANTVSSSSSPPSSPSSSSPARAFGGGGGGGWNVKSTRASRKSGKIVSLDINDEPVTRALPLLRRDLSFVDLINSVGMAFYRMCVSGILANIKMSGALEHFEPAPTFITAVPSFYFGTGHFGTGYYHDPVAAATLPPGAGQREARAVTIRKRARRFRAQALWDMLDSRWAAHHLKGKASERSGSNSSSTFLWSSLSSAKARALESAKLDCTAALEEEREAAFEAEREARGLPRDKDEHGALVKATAAAAVTAATMAAAAATAVGVNGGAKRTSSGRAASAGKESANAGGGGGGGVRRLMRTFSFSPSAEGDQGDRSGKEKAGDGGGGGGGVRRLMRTFSFSPSAEENQGDRSGKEKVDSEKNADSSSSSSSRARTSFGRRAWSLSGSFGGSGGGGSGVDGVDEFDLSAVSAVSAVGSLSKIGEEEEKQEEDGGNSGAVGVPGKKKRGRKGFTTLVPNQRRPPGSDEKDGSKNEDGNFPSSSADTTKGYSSSYDPSFSSTVGGSHAAANKTLEPSADLRAAHEALWRSVKSTRKHGPLRPLAPTDEHARPHRNLEKVSAVHEALREKMVEVDPTLSRHKLDAFDSLLATVRRTAEGHGHWQTRWNSENESLTTTTATTTTTRLDGDAYDEKVEEEEEEAMRLKRAAMPEQAAAAAESLQLLWPPPWTAAWAHRVARPQGTGQRDNGDVEGDGGCGASGGGVVDDQEEEEEVVDCVGGLDHTAARRLHRFELSFPYADTANDEDDAAEREKAAKMKRFANDLLNSGGTFKEKLERVKAVQGVNAVAAAPTAALYHACETVEVFATVQSDLTTLSAYSPATTTTTTTTTTAAAAATARKVAQTLAAGPCGNKQLSGGASGGAGGVRFFDGRVATTQVDSVVGLVAGAAADKAAAAATSPISGHGCGHGRRRSVRRARKMDESSDYAEDEKKEGGSSSDGGSDGNDGRGGAVSAVADEAGDRDADDKDEALISRAKETVAALAAAPVPPPGTSAETARKHDIVRAEKAVATLEAARRRRMRERSKRRRASVMASRAAPCQTPSCRGWMKLVDPQGTGLGGFGPGFNGFRGLAEEAAQEAGRAAFEDRKKAHARAQAMMLLPTSSEQELLAGVHRRRSSAASTSSLAQRLSRSSVASLSGRLSVRNSSGGGVGSYLEAAEAAAATEAEAEAEFSALSKLGSEVEGRGIGGSEVGLEQVFARQLRELHNAVRWGNTSTLAALLKRRPHLLGERDSDTGNTALHVAVQSDRFDFVEVFLRRFNVTLSRKGKGDKEEEVNGSDDDHHQGRASSSSPHVANHEGPERTRHAGDKSEVLGFVDVNVQNFKGNTALHMAIEYGLTHCQRMLVEFGADLNIPNGDGFSAVRGISGVL